MTEQKTTLNSSTGKSSVTYFNFKIGEAVKSSRGDVSNTEEPQQNKENPKIYIIDNPTTSHLKDVADVIQKESKTISSVEIGTDTSAHGNNVALRSILNFVKKGDGVNLSVEFSLSKNQLAEMLEMHPEQIEMREIVQYKNKLLQATENHPEFKGVKETVALLEQLTNKGVYVTVPAGNFATAVNPNYVNLLSFAKGVYTVPACTGYSAVNQFTIGQTCFNDASNGKIGTSFSAPRKLLSLMEPKN